LFETTQEGQACLIINGKTTNICCDYLSIFFFDHYRRFLWNHTKRHKVKNYSLPPGVRIPYIIFDCVQQEPGTPAEIMNALQYVRPGGGFIPDFPLFAKSDINGANRLPLYAWATVNHLYGW
jgi:hypothetical protein